MTMTARSSHWGSAVALTAASLLGACAGLPSEPVSVACPLVKIAAPANRLGHNNPQGELRFVAVIDELSSSCSRDDDDILVDIAFTLSARRGVALGEGPVPISYFLATVDPNRKIIDKQILFLAIDLERDRPSSTLRETVTLRLPASTEASGANYSLYLGFQPDQQPSQNKPPAQNKRPGQNQQPAQKQTRPIF